MGSKVRFGLKNVHIAPIVNGAYGTIFALPGAVSLSIDAEGDESNFAADDNARYFSKFINNGYTGTLEIAMINESFLTEVLGQTKDSNGVVTETANDVVKDFALMFEVNGDDGKRRMVFYKCSVSRPSMEANTTEDSIEVQTEELNITMSQDETGRFKSYVDEGSEAYATFFESVYGTSI